MYPYAMYSSGLTSRDSRSQEFTEDNPRYYFCCCHVGNISTVLTGFTLIFCIVSMSFCTAGILVPNSHTYFQNYHIDSESRGRPEEFRLFYHITLGILLAGSTVHLFTSILCLFGIRMIKPALIVSELIVTGLFVGLILFATISVTICMIILLGFLWFLTAADAALVFYASFHFYTLLLTYRYVRDKRRHWALTASRPRNSNNSAGNGKNVYFID